MRSQFLVEFQQQVASLRRCSGGIRNARTCDMHPTRMLFVIALVGCGGVHAGSGDPDAASEPAVCKANLEAAIDRTCTQTSDCVLVASSDCCGTVMLAVKQGTQTAFASAETTYEACLACGGRGCYHADLAEGGMVPQGGQSIVATCEANRCKSIVQ